MYSYVVLFLLHDFFPFFQALKATGKKKKKKPKSILDLIHEVNELDEEFQNFAVHIPGRQQMIEENFPLHLIDYKRPSIQWCCKNINTIRYGIRNAGEKGYEWVNAWSNLYTKETVPFGREAFDDSPEEDQDRFLTLMLEDINNSRARIYFKKWKFALTKEEERDRSQFEGNDQNRLVGGEEEGGTSVDIEKKEEKVEKERDEGVEEREKEEVEKSVREDFKVEVEEDIDPLDVVLVDEVDAPPVIKGCGSCVRQWDFLSSFLIFVTRMVSNFIAVLSRYKIVLTIMVLFSRGGVQLF